MNTFYSPPTAKSPPVKFSYASPTHQKLNIFSPFATETNGFRNLGALRPVTNVAYSPRLGERQMENKKNYLISSQKWKREQKENLKSEGKKSASQSVIIYNQSEEDPQKDQEQPLRLLDLAFRMKNQQTSTAKSLISPSTSNNQYLNQKIEYSRVLENKFIQHKNEKKVFNFSKLKPRHRRIQIKVSNAKIQDFIVGDMIGKGGIGRVFLAKHRKTGFYFALKIIKKADVKDVDQLAFSIKCHFFFNHPNLAQLYACFWDENCIFLVMEICIDGNLSKYRKKIKNDEEREYIVSGMAKGIQYMHNLSLRHGDLKLENILINHGFPKITDFDCIFKGSHKLFTQARRRSKLWGSPAYFSPDMIRSSSFALSDDIWSFGVIMYEIYCSTHPFSLKDSEDLSNIVEKGMIPFPPNLKQSTKMLISLMLAKKREERVAIDQVVRSFD